MPVKSYSIIKTRSTVVKLDLVGLQELRKRSKPAADKAVRSTAFQAEGYMKQLARKDTSAMANSVHVKTKDFDGSSAAIAAAQSANPGVEIADFKAPTKDTTARVGPATNYAVFQEFGTSRMAAAPFVTPGLQMAALDFIDALKRGVFG